MRTTVFRIYIWVFTLPRNVHKHTWSYCQDCQGMFHSKGSVMFLNRTHFSKHFLQPPINQFDCFQLWPRSSTWVCWETTSASGPNGTWTHVLWISSPTPKPLGHATSDSPLPINIVTLYLAAALNHSQIPRQLQQPLFPRAVLHTVLGCPPLNRWYVGMKWVWHRIDLEEETRVSWALNCTNQNNT